jgi:hypothetical protein
MLFKISPRHLPANRRFTSRFHLWLSAALAIASFTAFAAAPVQMISPATVSSSAKAAHANPLLGKGFKTEGVAISFNADALHQLALGEEALVSLPNGAQYAVVYDNEVDYRDGTRSWVGYLRDHGKRYRVIATSGPAGTYASIQTPDDDWSIVPGLEGTGFNLLVNATREAEKNPIPADANDFRIANKRNPSAVTDGADATSAFTKRLAESSVLLPFERSLGKVAPSPQATIDVLVVVTQGMATRLGSTLATRINQYFTSANTAYANSEADRCARLPRQRADKANGVGCYHQQPGRLQ